jgi:hypothetical protein
MQSKPAPSSDPLRRGVDRGHANDNAGLTDPVAAERALAFRNEPDPDNASDSGSLSERYLPFRLVLSLAVVVLVALAVSWLLWGR